MGLDGVELVMECEQEFGISIPDADASAVRTPGQLAMLIIKLMRQDGGRLPASICPSASLFYDLRRKLVSDGVQRDHIRPGSRFKDLMPTPGEVRRSDYTLRTHLGSLTQRTPADQVFRFLAPTLALAALAPLVYYTATQHAHNYVVGVVCGLSLLAVTTITVLYGCRRSALIDPDQQLGERINATIARSASSVENPQELAVWLRVRTIVAEQLGLAVDEVEPDADFVKDLGLG